MLRRLAILELLARHTGRSYHTAILHRGPQKHLLRSPTLVNRLPHVTHTRKALFSSDNSVIRKENNENKSTEEQQEEPVKRPRSFHDIDVNDELQEEFNKRKEEKKRRKKANQEDREEGEEEEDMEDEEDEEMPKRKKRSGAKIIGQLMMGGAIVGLLLFATSELYKNFVKPVRDSPQYMRVCVCVCVMYIFRNIYISLTELLCYNFFRTHVHAT